MQGKEGRHPINIDSRYFGEMVIATRAAIRALRHDLDEWERECDRICGLAVPELAAEASKVLCMEKADL